MFLILFSYFSRNTKTSCSSFELQLSDELKTSSTDLHLGDPLDCLISKTKNHVNTHIPYGYDTKSAYAAMFSGYQLSGSSEMIFSDNDDKLSENSTICKESKSSPLVVTFRIKNAQRATGIASNITSLISRDQNVNKTFIKNNKSTSQIYQDVKCIIDTPINVMKAFGSEEKFRAELTQSKIVQIHGPIETTERQDPMILKRVSHIGALSSVSVPKKCSETNLIVQNITLAFSASHSILLYLLNKLHKEKYDSNSSVFFRFFTVFSHMNKYKDWFLSNIKKNIEIPFSCFLGELNVPNTSVTFEEFDRLLELQISLMQQSENETLGDSPFTLYCIQSYNCMLCGLPNIVTKSCNTLVMKRGSDQVSNVLAAELSIYFQGQIEKRCECPVPKNADQPLFKKFFTYNCPVLILKVWDNMNSPSCHDFKLSLHFILDDNTVYVLKSFIIIMNGILATLVFSTHNWLLFDSHSVRKVHDIHYYLGNFHKIILALYEMKSPTNMDQ